MPEGHALHASPGGGKSWTSAWKQHISVLIGAVDFVKGCGNFCH